eukprot:359622-Chlamydomonas_euryale.AAC.5
MRLQPTAGGHNKLARTAYTLLRNGHEKVGVRFCNPTRPVITLICVRRARIVEYELSPGVWTDFS